MNSSDFQENKLLWLIPKRFKLQKNIWQNVYTLKSAGVYEAVIFLWSFTAKLALSITSSFITKESTFHPQQIVLLNVCISKHDVLKSKNILQITTGSLWILFQGANFWSFISSFLLGKNIFQKNSKIWSLRNTFWLFFPNITLTSKCVSHFHLSWKNA